jgi:hypothetical protein
MQQVAQAPTVFGENLLKVIERVDRPGSFSTSGDLPLTMPGLEVEGVGAIRLPLGKTQAGALIKRCSQAPYGKGIKTLVDTDVRRVWELDPKHMKFTNPKWDALVASITNQARIALGLNDTKLHANLYKLLVYETGSFFLPHRDGEKLDGMVATLVIALPSPHTGGELIIRHEGRRDEITLAGAASGHEMSYAAFYADCEHEVRPVSDGHRLCLVYNLTLGRSRRKGGVAAPRTTEVVASISEMLGNWPPRDEITKLAVTLAHQYTQDGLNIDTLKGIDRARADVLFDAAEQAGCTAHLALVTHWQSGSAEGEDYGYSRGRDRYRSWSYDDEDEEYSDEGTGHEMGEVYEESMSINHWSDRNGNKITYGEMDLDKAEIVSAVPPEDWDLGREEFEGYTGNAGMTLERWYHRAAIVIWPKQNNFTVLCDAGTDAAISGLKSMVGKWKRTRKSDQPEQRKSCLEFATAIIQTWSSPRFDYHSHTVKDKVDRSEFPLLLQELDDPDSVVRFMTDVMPNDGTIQLGESFPSFCKRHGWPTFEAGLTAIFDSTSRTTIARNTALLESLCLQRHKNVDRINVCKELAENAVNALQRLDNHASESDWHRERIDRAGLLVSLVKSLISVDCTEPLDELFDHTLSQVKSYDLTDAHLAAIFALESWLHRKLGKANRIVTRWLDHCRTELERRTEHAPTAPSDWRRAGKLSCSCADCEELSRFLADPNESVHRFKVSKGRRQHLHQIIDQNGCDLTHVTTRTSNPHTLVCTKTTASYQLACKFYARDTENLKRLRAVEKKI